MASDSSSENRRQARYAFPTTQRAAWRRGDELPPSDAFFPIECRDLSRSGISFYLEDVPPCEHVVLMISKGAETILLEARVAYSEMGYWNRRRGYLVGCELVKRIELPAPG